MEKGEFEKKWGDAFKEAEVSPSDTVWTNVELDLERAAGGKMKKRILFYQTLAAASFVFAMGIAAVYYLQPNVQSNDELAQEGNSSYPQMDSEVIDAERELTESSASISSASNASETVETPQLDNQFLAKTKDHLNVTSDPKSGVDLKINPQRMIAENNRSESERVDQESVATSIAYNQPSDKQTENANEVTVALYSDKILNNKKLPPLIVVNNPQLVIRKNESESVADPGMVLLAKLRDEEKKYADEDKKKSKEEALWTSIGFSAGSFNPNSTTSSVTRAGGFLGSNAPFSSDPSAGSSYSMGVQVGGKITNRLLLLGGINYLAQNASYTSNIATMESASLKASLNDLASSENYTAVTISPYHVTSNLQYISVPTQIGYLVIDRKFALQLNGGVATDLFLMNTLTPDSDNVSKVSQGAGSDSPYRTVLFSGLVSTELSYRFSERYRLALNPGFRYALNSMYKADVSTEASPITYDVALRFRYIFK